MNTKQKYLLSLLIFISQFVFVNAMQYIDIPKNYGEKIEIQKGEGFLALSKYIKEQKELSNNKIADFVALLEELQKNSVPEENSENQTKEIAINDVEYDAEIMALVEEASFAQDIGRSISEPMLQRDTTSILTRAYTVTPSQYIDQLSTPKSSTRTSATLSPTAEIASTFSSAKTRLVSPFDLASFYCMDDENIIRFEEKLLKYGFDSKALELKAYREKDGQRTEIEKQKLKDFINFYLNLFANFKEYDVTNLDQVPLYSGDLNGCGARELGRLFKETSTKRRLFHDASFYCRNDEELQRFRDLVLAHGLRREYKILGLFIPINNLAKVSERRLNEHVHECIRKLTQKFKER